MGCSPCQRLYITVACTTNPQTSIVRFHCWTSPIVVKCITTRPLWRWWETVDKMRWHRSHTSVTWRSWDPGWHKAMDEAPLAARRSLPGRFPCGNEDSGSYCSQTPDSPRGSSVLSNLHCQLDTERTCPIITTIIIIIINIIIIITNIIININRPTLLESLQVRLGPFWHCHSRFFTGQTPSLIMMPKHWRKEMNPYNSFNSILHFIHRNLKPLGNILQNTG